MPPDITLNYPKVLATLSNSTLGIGFEQAFGWAFGTVQKVFPTCDNLVVGNSILFEPEKWPKLVYGSSIYYLVDQDNAAFVENPAP
jgi:hypothetical protein